MFFQSSTPALWKHDCKFQYELEPGFFSLNSCLTLNCAIKYLFKSKNKKRFYVGSTKV